MSSPPTSSPPAIEQLMNQLSEHLENSKAQMAKSEEALRTTMVQLQRNERIFDERNEEVVRISMENRQLKAIIRPILRKYNKRCQELVDVLKNWAENRKSTIEILLILADDLERERNNTNIASLSGSLLGIVGSGVGIAGLILTPLTLGAATPLLIAGVATAAAGGAVDVGAGITDMVIGKTKWSQIEPHLITDCELAQKMVHLNEKRTTAAEVLDNYWKEYNDNMEKLSTKEPNAYKDLHHEKRPILKKTGAKLGAKELSKLFFNLSTAGLKITELVAPTAVRGVQMAGQASKVLSTTASKAVLGVSSALAAIGALINLRDSVEKIRHIDMYNQKEKKKSQQAIQDKKYNPEKSEKEQEEKEPCQKGEVKQGDKFKTRAKELLIGDDTISTQADMIRMIAESLQEQLKEVMENSIVKTLLTRNFDEVDDDVGNLVKPLELE